MKKTIQISFLLLSVLFFGVDTYAQTFVSTTPQNKNAILEEYTGIYCTYCPDGHKIANTIYTSNPGDVVLINIHEGYYANPQGNDPDFRIQYGTALVNAAGVTSYPAGSVNRRVFSGSSITAMNRGEWSSKVNSVLAESSPVNVAAKASIDFDTRELVVITEVYFTGNGTANLPYKLNVALLQNKVLGPQTGAASFYPEKINSDGLYEHNHMLRDLITGQWGVNVNGNTTGYLQVDTFRKTLPADINGIPLLLHNLEVAAFVAEGQQNILTGSQAEIDYIVPNGKALGSGAIVTTSSSIPSLCDDKFTPTPTFKNEGNSTLSKVDVNLIVDGGVVSTESITNIAPGASEVVTFGDISLSRGLYDIEYEFSIDDSNIYDVSNSNKALETRIYTLGDAASPLFIEEFESVDEYENQLTDNILVYNIESMSCGVVGLNYGSKALGANDDSDQSFVWSFYTTREVGKSLRLMTDILDFTTVASDAKLEFDYAYTSYQGSNDKLAVQVSTNCGGSYRTLWNKSGASLKTAPEVNNQNSAFRPDASHWVHETIDLADYIGESELLISFRGTSDYGDNLYVDNISITGVASVNDHQKVNGYTIAPNPATNFVTISIDAITNETLTAHITDLLGRSLQSAIVVNGKVSFETNNMPAGVYTVTVYDENQNSVLTDKIIVVE